MQQIWTKFQGRLWDLGSTRLKNCTLDKSHGHDRAGIVRPAQNVSYDQSKVQSMWPKLLGS